MLPTILWKDGQRLTKTYTSKTGVQTERRDPFDPYYIWGIKTTTFGIKYDAVIDKS